VGAPDAADTPRAAEEEMAAAAEDEEEEEIGVRCLFLCRSCVGPGTGVAGERGEDS
jgi:hypothetical protein